MAWLKSGYAPMCGHFHGDNDDQLLDSVGYPHFLTNPYMRQSPCVVGKLTNKFVVEKNLTFPAFSAFESRIPRIFAG